FVDGLCEAYDAAVERIDRASGQVFNLGGGPDNTLSLLELVEHLDRLTGRPLRPAFAGWRPGDQPVFVADVTRASEALGCRPRTGATEGVRKLARRSQETGALAGGAPAGALHRGGGGVSRAERPCSECESRAVLRQNRRPNGTGAPADPQRNGPSFRAGRVSRRPDEPAASTGPEADGGAPRAKPPRGPVPAEQDPRLPLPSCGRSRGRPPPRAPPPAPPARAPPPAP